MTFANWPTLADAHERGVNYLYTWRLGTEPLDLRKLGGPGYVLHPGNVPSTSRLSDTITHVLELHGFDARDVGSIKVLEDGMSVSTFVTWEGGTRGPNNGVVLDRRACQLHKHLQTPDGATRLKEARADHPIPSLAGLSQCHCVAAKRAWRTRWRIPVTY